MNLMRIIAREDPIAGIAISETCVRIAHVRRAKKKEAAQLALIEEPISPGTIVDGVIQKPEALVAALKKAISQIDTPYAIVSIPPHAVYSKILSFPRMISGDRLSEAINLALGFQLPFKKDETYIDHQTLPRTEANDILLTASPRSVIDGFSHALAVAGVKTVAIEPHTMSIAREYESAIPSLVVIPYSGSVCIAIFDQGIVRFSRSLPQEHYTEGSLGVEIERIIDFYASEYGTSPVRVEWKNVACGESHCTLLPPSVSPQDWLAALGALARAEISRKGDVLVSLLPVGTEQAYEFQKAIAFSHFLRNLTIGVAVFFVIAYGGTYSFMLTLKNRYTETLSTLAVSPVSAHVLEEEARAREFNELLATTASLVAESPKWSMFLESFQSSIGSGITISSIALDRPDQPIRIAGIAKSRAELNVFRDMLVARNDLDDVELPLTNLELRADIPFTITFALQDPTLLLH